MSRREDIGSGLSDRFKKSVSCSDDKKDFKELDLGSPVSPLQKASTSNSSSSGSTGSLPGRVGSGHRRSESVSSPPPGFPAGNICPSGKIVKTGMASKASKTDVLGSGTGNYGHGSVIRQKNSGAGEGSLGNLTPKKGNLGNLGNDAEELKRLGNESYKKGNFLEALNLYNKAISISPATAAYHCNRAAALIGLKRLQEAVKECEEAIRLDPKYVRAHHRLGSLFLSLGQVENARRHICLVGQQPDHTELQKLEAVEKHIEKCSNARGACDWLNLLREADAAIASGADSSPQLFACRAEAFLKLHQLDNADTSLSKVLKIEPTASLSQSKIFGMVSEAYVFFVQSQIELAHGRFENALKAIERARQIDNQNAEFTHFLNKAQVISQARTRGNELYHSERFTEAYAAYGEGLKVDPSNSVLNCNRAACWYKLGQWEKSVEDCNQTLRIQPNYTKALLRRAACNMKLERWGEAVRDYKALRSKLPDDTEIAESLSRAQAALEKSNRGGVDTGKYVELVPIYDRYVSVVSSTGPVVVHFKRVSNAQCTQTVLFLDTLCTRYPSTKFIEVDVDEGREIAALESIKTVPTFKIYKGGSLLKELVCPSLEELESSVRNLR